MKLGPRRDAESGSEPDTLLYALRVLRERWWIVALTTLLCAGIAVALSLSRDDVFEAESKVQFGGSRVIEAISGIERGSAQPERDAATEVLVAGSPRVTDRVREELGGGLGRDQLLDQVTVQAVENANVMTFTAFDGDPRQAARIANAYAEQYVDFNRDTELAQLDTLIRQLENQSDEIPEGAPERAEIEQRLVTARSQRAAASGGSRIIGTAEVPTGRSSPTPRRDAILGLILGLVLGLSLAFLLDLLDRRVKSVEEFERLYGMRALASIPQISFTARTQEDKAVGFEPYRVLRNAIGFAELTQRLDVMLVTSAMPSEGKSSVSMNLARAIALSGQRVVLVECDLRRPGLARHLDIGDPGGGLTTALVGHRPAAEMLRPMSPGLSHLQLLPSGPLPPNAAELLRSPRMGTLLAELTADGTRVILDAPPLLPVADAQGLLDHPQIGAALIVTRAFQTTRDEVRRARAILDQHRLQPLGIVVTGVEQESTYGYYGVDPAGVPSAPEGSTPPPRAVSR